MLNERRMKMKKSFLSIAFMAVFMLMELQRFGRRVRIG